MTNTNLVLPNDEMQRSTVGMALQIKLKETINNICKTLHISLFALSFQKLCLFSGKNVLFYFYFDSFKNL